ncbi:MAG: TonB-dependent receptor [Candidatus Omnitrophota bacterium]
MAKKTTILFLLITLIFSISKTCLAQETENTSPEYNLGDVLVSATKTEVYQAEIGSSTTVITSEYIKKTQKRTVQELLRDVPGISVTQTGSFGGTTSVYLRGANKDQTMVLIDGIEVNDPMSGGFDFAHLTTDNIERIEVVRGPQSTLYGSDAMAGVINIITKKGKGKPKINGYFEGGSHNTFRENLGLNGDINKFNYSLSASRLDSNGINKVPSGFEKDGYLNTAVSSKIGYKIFDNSELSLAANFIDAKTSLDAGAYNDDPNNTARWRNIAGKLAFDQAINSIWDHKLSYSYSQTRRKYKNDPDPAHPTNNTHNWFKGNISKAEWQHNISPAVWDTLTCGFDYKGERGLADGRSRSNRLDRKTINTMGYYLQNQFKLWEKLFITPGLRVDDHELFGTKATYKISTAWLIPQTETRLKGNWGTGFKAPTLYQLYDTSSGNTNLTAEENKSYDFGFEQSFFKDKVSFELTYFYNDFKNLINWIKTNPSTWAGEYRNINKAMTKGFEVGAKVRPIENLTFGANFTYTNTEDKETGLTLERRPKRQANFDVDWAFLPKANLNLGMNYVGKRRDSDYNTVSDKAYTIFRTAAYYDITKNFQIFGRIENLFDKKYQEVYGYETLGRSFYAGVKADF